MDRNSDLHHLVGVYDADGGILDETRYFIGHLIGTANCSLCHITHSPVRRKPSWDALLAALGVPFQLRHRNELASPLDAAVSATGLPVVLVVLADGSIHPVLDAIALDQLDGSVAAFGRELSAVLNNAPWQHPASPDHPATSSPKVP